MSTAGSTSGTRPASAMSTEELADALKRHSSSDVTTPLGQQSPKSLNSDLGPMSTAERQLLLDQKLTGLFKTLEPFVHKLDEHVISVRTSQELLNQQLNALLVVLHQIKLQESIPNSGLTPSVGGAAAARLRTSADISADLEEKSRRLLGLKRRLTLVHSILQTVNSRSKKLLLAHNSRIPSTTLNSTLPRP